MREVWIPLQPTLSKFWKEIKHFIQTFFLPFVSWDVQKIWCPAKKESLAFEPLSLPCIKRSQLFFNSFKVHLVCQTSTHYKIYANERLNSRKKKFLTTPLVFKFPKWRNKRSVMNGIKNNRNKQHVKKIISLRMDWSLLGSHEAEWISYFIVARNFSSKNLRAAGGSQTPEISERQPF